MSQHDPLYDRDCQEAQEEANDELADLRRRFDERYEACADSQELIKLMNDIKALEEKSK